MSTEEIVVGLDIGSTKVCAVIAERSAETGAPEITGVGTVASTGMKKGAVVNIEATLRSLQSAIEKAEMMSGREVKRCVTGIGGNHIRGFASRGVVAVTGRNQETREIGGEDIARVMDAAKAMAIPMDREVLEVIPRTFTVDNQGGIKDPRDMIGVRLEVDVYIITCDRTGGMNLVKCVNRAGFEVDSLVLQTLAAGRAALMPEEKDMGALLIDIGGGTTDALVYQDGAPSFTATILAGGSNVTGDISTLKGISFESAEKIKLEMGCCWEPFLEKGPDILIPGVGGRPIQPIPRRDILNIARLRMEELFKMVKDRLDPGLALGAGVVLTGGGAQLLGAADLASHVFGLPVRVGSPRSIGGLVADYRGPAFATAVGLALEGFDRQGAGAAPPGAEPGGVRAPKGESILSRFKGWLEKEFF